MSETYEFLVDLQKQPGKWAQRISAQLMYAVKLSKVKSGKYDRLIAETADFLRGMIEEEGALTRAAARQAETMILPLAEDAKAYKVICAAHAHIDMNWMWGYAETAAVAMDTFRTMLNLMQEYPQFTFSQSQASVYEIVEKYDPEMLSEIRQRVQEGRWEVTASTWVETDKNMPSGESLARHILYTKLYLSRLLDLDPDSLRLDFEPDTFGHSRNVPEILANGGVSFYYHCRGKTGENIYRWQAPSGRSLIVYYEPYAYNAAIDTDVALAVPEFCSNNGLDTMLKVYGVGDHGGGPTRRDLEKILEMDSWPVYPRFAFGRFADFYKILESKAQQWQVVDDELNFVFSGCYTTQSRIKLANRLSEARLYDAEVMSTMAGSWTGNSYPAAMYAQAWRKVLFSQFHDILTGSGVIETREHAMGQFQQVLTATNSGTVKALRKIAAAVDTSALPFPDDDPAASISEGAGTGFEVSDYALPQAERGRGKNRILHFFNSLPFDRSELTEVTIWDWPGDPERLEIRDSDGRIVSHQLTSGKAQQLHPAGAFWGHRYIKVLLNVAVPACGYSTCIVREKERTDITYEKPQFPRVEEPDGYLLENEKVRIVFDTKHAAIVSLLDKESGREIVSKDRPAGIFRLIDEDTAKGMTSWIIGRYMNVSALDQTVKVTSFRSGEDLLRQWIAYEVAFRSSSLSVVISLDRGQSSLGYYVTCDWQERAVRNKSIPQLNFFWPLAGRCREYTYDVPYGTVSRPELNMDVPANSWAMAKPDNEQKAIAIITDTKYGFRGFDDSLALTLIRSSYDPDPYPENYIHKFSFRVDLVDDQSAQAMISRSLQFNHPLVFVSGSSHTGKLAPSGSALRLMAGSVVLSAVKMAENGDRKMIIRLYETAGQNTRAILRLDGKIKAAFLVDLLERPVAGPTVAITGEEAAIPVQANSLVSVCLELD